MENRITMIMDISCWWYWYHVLHTLP